MTRDNDFDRALAHDDALELRRARRTGQPAVPEVIQCQILFAYQERCDQCARLVWKPHVAAGRTFCRRCCPACASSGGFRAKAS